MNQAINDTTVKRFHYENHDQLGTHLADVATADKLAHGLNTLNGLTAYEYVAKIWTSEPDQFIVNPIYQMPELNAY